MQPNGNYSIFANIDNIVYGDLLYDDKEKISCKDKIIGYMFATGLINKFFAMKPPKNSSQQTINELMFLERVTANATQKDIDFATAAEVREKECYVTFCNEYLSKTIKKPFFDKLLVQTDPILMLLKNHHNRPRPYQLAPYYGIQISFKVPVDALHPAYPSGHAFDSYIIENVLSSLFPQKQNLIKNFCNKMATSRFTAGVHYPSDNEYSKILAETIISNNLIKIPKNI